MTITFETAIERLQNNPADFTTKEALLKLVGDTSLDVADGFAQGRVTVLYSGMATADAHTGDIVKAMIANGEDVRLIDKTQAAKLLLSDEFLAAVGRLEGVSLDEMKSRASFPIKDWLFAPADGPWSNTSKRFVAETVGEVRLLGARADITRVFGMTELPELLNSKTVTMVDGIELAHLKSMGTVEKVFEALKTNALAQAHFSGLSVTNTTDYLRMTPDSMAAAMADKDKAKAFQEMLNGFKPDVKAQYISGNAALIESGKELASSGVVKGLNKLGFIGGILSFAFAANSSAAAESAGNPEEAKEIMKLWAVDMAGSEIGAVIGTAIGTIVGGLMVGAGVTLSAPLLGALALGGALIGGIFFAEGAKELYDLMDDRDGTGKRDIVDRLEALWYGQTYTLSDPPPADLWGVRQTMNASLTKEQIFEAAKTDIAWRYAVRELNPFVILGADYARHNLDGSLDYFDEITNPNGLTDAFLKDRIDMLWWKMQFDKKGAKDDNDIFAPEKSKTYDEDWDSNSVQGNLDYVDHMHQLPGSNGPLTLAIDGQGISLHDRQIIFGKNKPNEGDTLEGEGDDDRIYGLAGNDTIRGEGGNDYLEGNAGDDKLYGGDDSDTLKGGAGNDILWGGAGDDVLHGGAGDDNIGGEGGNDFLSGGAGTDTLLGGDDNDYLLEVVGGNFTTMYGDSGNDILEVTSAEGDTILKGGTGNDLVLGGGGTNSIEGGKGNDLLRGGSGIDIIEGGEDADNIEGGAGTDAITGGAGADYLRGGIGNDSYFYENAEFGTDLIEDTQGEDELNIEAIRITSANYDASKLAWITGNGYEIRQYKTGSATMLAISGAGGAQNTIYIRNWSAGQFGIVLEGADAESARPDVPLQPATTRAENNYVDYLLSDAGDGGEGNDFVRGSDAASVLAGGTGNDVLDGRGGDDWIEGGIGNDVILTGDGKDVAYGGVGDDIIHAGYNWDMQRGIYTATGADVVYYQAGLPAGTWLKTNPRTDIALYYVQRNPDGSTTNVYHAAHSELAVFDVSFERKREVNETYSGYMYWFNTGDADASLEPSLKITLTLGDSEKAGQPVVEWEDRPTANFGKPMSVALELGNAKTVLKAGTGEQGARLWGGSGDDVIYGANNSDKLYGEADNDLLVGYGGDDELYGGEGTDEISGGDGRDFLDGGDGDDQLVGGFGADVLYGGLGNDALNGDAPQLAGANGYPPGLDVSRMAGDFLDGGVGQDTLWGKEGDDYLYGGADQDTLYGGLGEDHAFGEAGQDELQGGAGGDYLDGGAERDLLFGEEGDDILVGGAGDDQLDGGADNDILDAGDNDDVLLGGDGADILRGGANDDVLYGDMGADKDGADILEGGTGNDMLSGGGLGDTYVFAVGDGQDSILDDGADGSRNSIVFKFGAADVRAVRRTGDDLLVEYGGTDSVRVQGFYSSNAFGLGYQGSGAEMIDQGEAQARIASIDFADGTSWGIADILAMAPAPVPGELPPDQFADMASVYFVNALLSREEIRAAGKHALSFSFVSAFPADTSTPMLFTDEQKQSVRAALARFSAALDLRFTEIGEVGGETADLVFQMDDLTSVQMGAYAGYATPAEGRIHVNSNRYGVQIGDEFGNMKTRDSLAEGESGFQMLLHEIAHALGLKHPFEAPLLPKAENNAGNTVMSYTQGDTAPATDLAMFDIAALQYLYGVAKDRQTGDDVYTFEDRYVQDSGGVDTFDASAETVDVGINLERGGWLHRGAKNASILTEGQSFIGFGSDIENAKGGSGNDLLVGNDGANLLEGGAGNDSLTGGAGDDMLAGGAGADTYLFAGAGNGRDKIVESGQDTRLVIDGVGANDVYYVDGAVRFATGDGRIEVDLAEVSEMVVGGARFDRAAIAALFNARMAEGDLALGAGEAHGRLLGTGNWRLSGNDLANLLQGNAGHNTLEGGGGDDTLAGGLGNDTLRGDLGSDTYLFQRGDGQELIVNTASDYLQAVDRLQLGAGIGVAEVTLSRTGNDLRLDLGAGDSVTVQGYFATGNQGKIDQLAFADGTVWDQAAIELKTVRSPTEGNDILSGTADADLIHGLGGSDVVRGNDGDDRLFGDAGNDTLEGGAGDDSLEGGTGYDVLDGGAGSDTYVFGFGDGLDGINENDATPGAVDTLVLRDGVTPASVVLERSGTTLAIKLRNASGALSSDSLWITDFFARQDNTSKIEIVRFADGTVWTAAQIKAKLDAAAITAGNDYIDGYAWDDVLDGLGGNDMIYGDDGNDSLTGGAGRDTLSGGAGDDTLVGGADNDELVGGAGSDTYVLGIGDGRDIIKENDTTPGAIDTLVLRDGITPASIVLGRSGSDLHIEYMHDGYLSYETFWVNGFFARQENTSIEFLRFADGTVWNAAQMKAIVDAAAVTAGNDRIDGYAWDDALDGLGGNDTLYGADGNDTLAGGAGDDQIEGGNGNDILAGGSGNDVLVGGAGDDEYRFNRGDGNDAISNIDTGGVNRIRLGANIGPSDVAFYKHGSALILVLNGGIDQLSVGGYFAATGSKPIDQVVFDSGLVWDAAEIGARVTTTHANVLVGTGGNDVFVVDDLLDTVSEAANAGTDTVQSSVAYSLGANLENLTLTGVLSVYGWGNELNNTIIGNSGSNRLFGDNGNDLLRGGAGNDTLEGGVGDDTLEGGAGDDTYIHNTFSSGYERVMELAGEGTDTVISDFSYTLEDNVENLILVGDVSTGYSLTLTGNALDNYLTGNRNSNTLIGGTGADTMSGGGGADYYYVDNVADVVIERPEQYLDSPGDDLVLSTVTFTLSDRVENLTLMGSGPSNGYGNDGNNMLTAAGAVRPLETYPMGSTNNYAANILAGGKGDDSYVLGDEDSAVELAGEGNDTVYLVHSYSGYGPAPVRSLGTYANIENLDLHLTDGDFTIEGNGVANILTGNDDSNKIIGGAGDDRLIGLDGFDTLDGGVGADYMQGDDGDDTYIVDNAGDQVVDSDGYDTIRSSVSVLASNGIERIILTGNGAISATGNAGANYLDGSENSAANLLAGGGGDDVYVLGAGDAVLEAAGAGTDSISSNGDIDLRQFANVEGAILTGYGATRATGTAGNDRLDGSANGAANVLDGGAGDDTYVLGEGDIIIEAAGGGNDTVIADNYTLADNLENLTLNWGGYAIGNAGNNTITGTEYYLDSYLDGGAGADRLIGGLSNNTFVVDQAGDTVEARGYGTNSVISGISYTLGEGLDNLTLSGTAETATGNARDNTLAGHAGANLLVGGEGSDRYVFGFGSGNDRIDNSAVDNASATDTVAIAAGVVPAMLARERRGNDLVLRLGSIDTLTIQAYFASGGAQKIDQVQFADGTTWNQAYLDASPVAVFGSAAADTLAGTTGVDLLSGLGGNDTLTGLAGNDYLEGNDGDDLLDGGTGADGMAGGAGNDTYIVDNVGDGIVEGSGEGVDLVKSSVSYVLSAGVENLTLTGTAAAATGNALANVLLGNASANTLTGNGGNDTLTGGNGSDTYRFTSGDGQDTIDNTATDSTTTTDTLALMDDWLDPASVTLVREGNDLKVRLGANDSVTVAGYFAGSTQKIDRVTFTDGTVWSQTYLTTNAMVALVGTAGNDVLTGTSNPDLIDGREGNDTVSGGAGNDLLFGGDGADLLDGGAGIDRLDGGAGDDRYLVDDSEDTVFETAGGGVDLVLASVDYELAAEVENLTLTGTAWRGVGNDLDNILTGNDGDNRLEGGAGADLMLGGLGDDSYYVDSEDDVVVELADGGIDTIYSSIDMTLGEQFENLRLQGYDAPLNATGNARANWIEGNNGNNVLTGGQGNDNMDGYDGVDTYMFAAGSGHDVVYDGEGVEGDVLRLQGVAPQDVTIERTLNDLVIRSGADRIDLVYWFQGEARQNFTLNFDDGTVWDRDELARRILPPRGSAGDDTMVGDARADRFDALGGNDMLYGLDGNDTLIGGAGDDYLVGGTGADTYEFGGNFGADAVLDADDGSGEPDLIVLRDLLPGQVMVYRDSESLWIDAGGGNRIDLQGWFYDPAATSKKLQFADGSVWDAAQLEAQMTIAPSTEFADFLYGTESGDSLSGLGGADELYGMGGNDTLRGGAGDDYLVGGTGSDILDGGAGADYYNFGEGDGRDVVIEVADAAGPNEVWLALDTSQAVALRQGYDLVLTFNAQDQLRVTDYYRLALDLLFSFDGGQWGAAEIADMVALSTPKGTAGPDLLNGTEYDDVLDGLAGNDTLYGYAGNDLLTGGLGNDSLIGGAGDDTYVVDSASDVVTEKAGEGVDTVQASVSITLAANVENLVLAGTGAINGTGNALNNSIVGNSGANTLDGGAGADLLAGGAGNDVYLVDSSLDVVTENANEGSDTVQASVGYTLGANLENLTLTGTAAINGTGNALINVLTGNSAANTLDGGVGADSMSGGAGNDIYIVDNSADVVTEAASAGTDTVQASVSHTLAVNVENLTLTGSGAINGTGNTGSNSLTGNGADNVLDGGTGIDTLVGGGGNDTYMVDNVGDIVTEALAEGTDLVQAGVSYTLAANVENLTLTGTTAINGTGNALDNVLVGNAAINTLTGGAGNDKLDGGVGADKLTGGLGNDTYVVDNVGDVVTEAVSEGIDQVQSSITLTMAANIEALFLTGSGAINGTGNTADNLIVGNSGSNTLNGGTGNDILQGGLGVDTLTDTAGNNLLDGGAGNDVLTGGTGKEFLVGGAGNDTITTSTGADIIAFNRGDGQDVVNASTGSDNTVSLGNGILYADLLFKKSTNDLILVTGTSDQITFKDWYLSTSNRNVANLQVVIEGGSDYNAASANKLNNKKVEQFNFGGLATAFDQARAANPTLTSWALSSSLLSFYLSGSDTAALGGDLAYQYARDGNLADISMTPAQALLAGATFGTGTQNLQAPASLQDLSPRLI